MELIQKVKEKIDTLYSLIDGRLKNPSFIHPNYFYVGYGMDITDGRYSQDEQGWLYINMGEKEGNHIIVYGKSGSGKSEFLSRKTYEEIMLGKQSFCIDPKGSKSWIEAFLKANYRKGYLSKKDEIPLILSLPYPNASFKFNPLYGMEPEEIADIVASGIPDSKEPFWKNISFEITLAVAYALKAMGYQDITFKDIYENINIEKIQNLEKKLAERGDITSKYFENAMSTISQLSQYDSQYFSKVNSSLRTYLTRIVTGPVGQIISIGSRNNLLHERLQSGKLRFYAFLGAESLGTVAYDVGRILISWLLKYVGKMSRDLKIIQPQLRANFDEVTELGFAEINKAIRLVRERNVSITMATQSPKGFASAFSKDGEKIVDDIMNSSSAIIYLKMNDQDLDDVAAFAGKTQKFKVVVSSSHFNLVAQPAEIIEPNDIRQLEKGMGYCFQNGKTYFFYSPLIKDKLEIEVDWGQKREKEIEESKKKKTRINLELLAKAYIDNADEAVVPQTEDEYLTSEVVQDINGKIIVHLDKLSKLTNDITKLIFYSLAIKEIYQEEVVNNQNKYSREMTICLLAIDRLGKYTKSGKGYAELTDLETHTVNVYKFAVNLSEKYQLEKDKRDLLIISALAHDIGKLLLYNEKGVSVGEKGQHENIGIEMMKNAGFNQDIIDVLEGRNIEIKRIMDEADHSARKEEEEEKREKIKTAEEKILQGQVLDLYNAIANKFIDKETGEIKEERKYDLVYESQKKEIYISREILNEFNIQDDDIEAMEKLGHTTRKLRRLQILEGGKPIRENEYLVLNLEKINVYNINNIKIKPNDVRIKERPGTKKMTKE